MNPVAGWYPDPGDSSGLRWWDGAAWTAHTHPAPVAAPVATAPVGSAPAGAGFGVPGASASTATPIASATTSTFGTPQYAPMGTQTVVGAGTGASRGSSVSNRYALITFGIVALYLVIAFTSHVVVIGILPLGMSLRSKAANEPMAPIAIGAAIVAIVVAVLTLTGH